MEDKKYNEWIKPGIFNGLQKVSIPLFGVLSTALLAHEVLSKHDMGVWVNFLTITTFAEMFRDGIVRSALIRYINFSEKKDHVEIMSSAFFLNVLISLLAAILLFTFSHHIEGFLKSPGLSYMLRIYAFTLIFLVFFSHIEWLMYAHSSFKNLFLTYLVRQGGTLLAIFVYYLIFGMATVKTLVFIYTGGIAAGMITGFLLMRSLFSLRFVMSGKWISTLWNFGKFVFGTNIGSLIFRSADQFLLSNITGSAGLVASQNISIRIVNVADIPSQTIGDILFPKSSNPDLLKRPGQIKYYYEKAVGSALSIVLPFIVVVLLFPKYIILILAGRQYFDAIPYLQVVSFTAIFLAYIKQWGVIIDSTGRPQINFIVLVILSALQITFCYFFISRYSLMGAAYALLSTNVIGFIITQSLLHRYFKINFLNCFKYCFLFYPEIFSLLYEKFLRPKFIKQ